MHLHLLLLLHLHHHLLRRHLTHLLLALLLLARLLSLLPLLLLLLLLRHARSWSGAGRNSPHLRRISCGSHHTHLLLLLRVHRAHLHPLLLHLNHLLLLLRSHHLAVGQHTRSHRRVHHLRLLHLHVVHALLLLLLLHLLLLSGIGISQAIPALRPQPNLVCRVHPWLESGWAAAGHLGPLLAHPCGAHLPRVPGHVGSLRQAARWKGVMLRHRRPGRRVYSRRLAGGRI